MTRRRDDTPELIEAETADRHSYGQILKSSALIGLSTVVNMAIGIVRAKAMAVWLGPAGFGLTGLYSSITDLAQTVAGMGINSSGVRQIAEAVGTGDAERIALTAVVLRRTAVGLGVVGALFLIAFSRQISVLTFGSDQHTVSVELLSVVVFFSCLSSGQAALIQGTRRISDLVKSGILSAAGGTITTIPLVYFFREGGIVPSLICGAAISLMACGWYSRKIKVSAPRQTIAQIGHEAAALLKLGFAFMAGGLMMTGASYAIKVFVLRKAGFEAAGWYQAAWTVGGVYVGVILGAMGTDFYPRLAAAARDNSTCNRLVNEQTLVSILLTGPGVTATLTFAPLIITLLYSSRFQHGVDVLRWLCLGMALRVISWAMASIIAAKGAQKLFLYSEAGWTIVYIGLAWVCVNAFGLNGAGIAFFVSYIFHVFIIYWIVRRLSGFRWSAANLRLILTYTSIVAMVFCSSYALSYPWAMVVGIFSVAAMSLYSIRAVLNLVSLDLIPRSVVRMLAWLRLVRVT